MSAKDTARRYFDLIGKGDSNGAIALFAPGARFTGPMGELPVPDGLRMYLKGFETSFPGHRFEITQTIESGDQVSIEGFWSGTHAGPLALPDGSTVPATNRRVRAPFCTVFRVRGDKIQEHRGYWDLAGFMAQLQGKGG